MAEKIPPSSKLPPKDLGFLSVQLLKEKSLGIGSYGSVCKARCYDIVCAAKIIHPTLVLSNTSQQISPDREHRLPIRRFKTECGFLKEMKHPNIVQYLGLYLDPETGLPVLLMELMDESLTHFLESSTESISYHVQLNICLDITQALSFLHINGIIHRDLSSNNILLIGKSRAKLSDFGMAKLISQSGISNTECPGADVYMPPEAVGSQSLYTEKGDVFSFGVNIIQILTRKFPKPSSRLESVQIDHPQVPLGRVEVHVSEIKRRHNHISEIDTPHPLLSIALDCMKDEQSDRPSSAELCQQLATLKNAPRYSESERETEERLSTQQTIIAEKSLQITDLHRQFLSQQQWYEERIQRLQQVSVSRQLEIEDLRSEVSSAVERAVTASDHKMEQVVRDSQEELKAEMKRMEDSLLQKDQIIEEKRLRIEVLEQILSAKTHHREQLTEIITLSWTWGGKAPCRMDRYTDAVVDGSTVYFRPGVTRSVYAFDSTSDSWCQLPDCHTISSALTIVNSLLTTIGGIDSNQLFSLVDEGSKQKWKEVLPYMPTKRSRAAAVCNQSNLIVMGGEGEGQKVLKTVEVLNTGTQQWATAAGLPQPMYLGSATVCGDRIYFLGGMDKSCSSSNLVFVCSLDALLQSCRSSPFMARLSVSRWNPVWSTVADLPVIRSTCVTFQDRLLAIGGSDSASDPTTAVHMYSLISDSWLTVSRLGTARWWCFTAVVPDGRIMVVGGWNSKWSNPTDTIEFGTVDQSDL